MNIMNVVILSVTATVTSNLMYPLYYVVVCIWVQEVVVQHGGLEVCFKQAIINDEFCSQTIPYQF